MKINCSKKETISKRVKIENFIVKIFIMIGFISIIVLITAFLSYFYMLKNEEQNFLTYKDNIDSQKIQLSYELNELEYEKKSLLKEINDLTYSKNELEKYYQELSNSKIIDKWVPDGIGDIHSYMTYSQNWISSSAQYKFHIDISYYVYYDEYGYAKLDDRYIVAVKPYYGTIGDYIDVYQEDGSIIYCVIGDNKGFENSDIYSHYDGSVVEFMVKDNTFKGVKQTKPEFCQKISVIKNIGNYYD